MAVQLDISVIIPAYNESARIGPTLTAVQDYAVQRAQALEVVVVDDGSTDDTAAQADPARWRPLALQVLANDRNRGKGFSVRRGVLASRGDPVLICDADLSTPIEELDKLLPWLEHECDVVIGSRDMPDSVLEPPQPPLRRVMAATFRGIRRRLLLPDLKDTQCGFKCFRRDAARAVFTRQTLDGWLFDCEVLGLAEWLGFTIREVGVLWRDRPDSRVRVVREALRALPTLWAIRRRLAQLE
jgi:dolichyl-phosphate beta-glucosyltransferase